MGPKRSVVTGGIGVFVSVQFQNATLRERS